MITLLSNLRTTVIIALLSTVALLATPFVIRAIDPTFDIGEAFRALGLGVLSAIALMAVVWGVGTLVGRRDERALRDAEVVRFEFHDATLFRFERPVRYRGLLVPRIGREALTDLIPLTAVGFASWDISPIMLGVGADDGVKFWDRNPELELDLFGPRPTNKSAVLLGRIKLSELDNSLAAKTAMIAHVNDRARNSLFDANVDLDTGDLLEENLPPLADGVNIFG